MQVRISPIHSLIEYKFGFFDQIKKLKELRAMLMETDPCVAVTVRKLVMVSLMEIFKDIVPAYRIRPLTETEKNTKVRSVAPGSRTQEGREPKLWVIIFFNVQIRIWDLGLIGLMV